MRLKFLDRENERSRLTRAFSSRDGSFCCLYGRRRCGKSRLLQEVLPGSSSVYYVGDEREPSLQRASLAASIAAVLPGFDDVSYPDWGSLLDRWYREAHEGAILVLDEFAYLVSGSRELPSIVQKLVDQYAEKTVHLVIAGSSQRMMQGLVLDAAAPLYGRAREIMEIGPLGAAWLREAFGFSRAIDVVKAYSVWGGIPRYWELALDSHSNREAIQDLVLDPHGVLHSEPRRLLLDDIRETAQASSILSLVGGGCNRISEIASRLEKPVTSLTRPLSRLLEIGLVSRELPFGTPSRSGKKSLYRIRDPFLAFWFRFVEPNRSRLEAGSLEAVAVEIEKTIAIHQGAIWETLVRDSVPLLPIEKISWHPARRWWGAGTDRKMLEIDVAAESVDGKSLLLGEVKLTADAKACDRAIRKLQDKAARFPPARNYGRVIMKVFAARSTGRKNKVLVSADDVIDILK